MPPDPTPSPAPAVSQHPPHRLTIYEVDRKAPLVVGRNPLQLDVLELPHEVTLPRRERAATALVAQHTRRSVLEINHTTEGHLTAVVAKD